ncbi:substrate-binding domain-containing protein [Kitasatospora sp. NPDC085879]|uniref:substrate-binding domain-containing protein n=1 Tax=Kitasatospora sp. NPDC085879 TaxID=3154769 RepID=UPI00344317D4
MRIRQHRSAALAVAVSAALVFAACAQTGGSADLSAGAAGSDGFSVGVLMPDNNATRYQNFDKPLIEKRIKELCGACTVKYANAQGDASAQRHQLDTMLISGVRVLIFDAVDAGAMRRSVQQARDAGVPVIAYDRLAGGPISGFVSFDTYAIGRLQAQALLRAMGAKAQGGQVLWLASPFKNSPASFPLSTSVAMPILKSGGVRLNTARAFTIPAPNKQDAYAATSAAIASAGPETIDGVYAADDVIAAGAVAALKAAHVDPLPPVVGEDAELPALRRLVTGEQYMTVYKPYEAEADTAAQMAVALGRGGNLDGIAKTTVDSFTTKGVPAKLLTPVAVTAENIKLTVVADGMYTVHQICTAELAAACRNAGLE